VEEVSVDPSDEEAAGASAEVLALVVGAAEVEPSSA
jgi:hypothetical protein